MLPPDDDKRALDEGTVPSEAELVRNRLRTLVFLCSALALVTLWWTYRQFLAQSWRPDMPAAVKPVADVEKLDLRPASPQARRKNVYPYSVIPGGVYSAEALAQAIASDPIAARHYDGFDVANARAVFAPAGLSMFASYRVGDGIYWTRRPVALHEHEVLLTDGVYFIRARCGNRLWQTARSPLGPKVDVDTDEAESQWDVAENTPVAAPSYPAPLVVAEVFPEPLITPEGGLTGDAIEAAVETPVAPPPREDETLSGYAGFRGRLFVVHWDPEQILPVRHTTGAPLVNAITPLFKNYSFFELPKWREDSKKISESRDDPEAVPEPAAFILAALGLTLFAVTRRGRYTAP